MLLVKVSLPLVTEGVAEPAFLTIPILDARPIKDEVTEPVVVFSMKGAAAVEFIACSSLMIFAGLTSLQRRM